MKKILPFAVMWLATIVLSALMAHLLELRGKMNLSEENYFTVQSIYNGWAWIGIIEIVVMVLLLTWIISSRKQRALLVYLLFSFICFASGLIVFFIYTFPANQQTLNWTARPGNWAKLRIKWEYSHAGHAILYLLGFSSLIAGLLKKSKHIL
ncbi:MAG TPA: hypothetical protein VFW07_09625 [Parafilimonas sp.]|nr:hypothetical protein [Parafilimonas sp.]